MGFRPPLRSFQLCRAQEEQLDHRGVGVRASLMVRGLRSETCHSWTDNPAGGALHGHLRDGGVARMGRKQESGTTKAELGQGTSGMDQAEFEGFSMEPIGGQISRALENLESGGGARRDLPRCSGPELAERTALAMSHLIGYGLSKDAARVAILTSDTAEIPLDLLEPAMRLSRQTHDSSFPPTVGQVISCAKQICLKADPERYRLPTGGQRAPRWYTAMNRTRFNPSRQIAAAH